MAAISLPVYPGIALQNNSRGPDVAFMQTQLNGLGISTQVDGIFGNGTNSSVRMYQMTHGLTADGIIGMQTWNSITQTYAAQFPQNPVPYPGIVIRQGALGSMVRYLQAGLNTLRQIYTAQTQLSVDGVYGSGTLHGVQIFQRQFGLGIDGQTGQNTWGAFIRVLTAQAAGTPAPVLARYAGTPLQQGSQGDAVRLAQSYLAQVQRANGLPYPPPAVDGNFGSGTRNAVLGFQAAYGLHIDGVIGPNTWNRLVVEFNNTL